MTARCLVVSSFCVVILAQNPEAGRIERQGDRAVLIVDSPRPLDSAAMTLAEEFGIRLNVEDPPYLSQEDVLDVTAKVSRDPHIQHRVLIPKGGRLEVAFALGTDGLPADPARLFQMLADAANAKFPFRYRLDTDGNWYTLVPTRTRDEQGQAIEITPLLDRRVTIPPGVRSIAASANLMAEALSVQTGMRVSCCQGVIAGIPWGMPEVLFEARDEPARSVLKRLIRAAAGTHPIDSYWLERCDPLPSRWCFINLTQAAGPGASARTRRPADPHGAIH